jgi:hypothetical protein
MKTCTRGDRALLAKELGFQDRVLGGKRVTRLQSRVRRSNNTHLRHCQTRQTLLHEGGRDGRGGEGNDSLRWCNVLNRGKIELGSLTALYVLSRHRVVIVVIGDVVDAEAHVAPPPPPM